MYVYARAFACAFIAFYVTSTCYVEIGFFIYSFVLLLFSFFIIIFMHRLPLSSTQHIIYARIIILRCTVYIQYVDIFATGRFFKETTIIFIASDSVITIMFCSGFCFEKYSIYICKTLFYYYFCCRYYC